MFWIIWFAAWSGYFAISAGIRGDGVEGAFSALFVACLVFEVHLRDKRRQRQSFKRRYNPKPNNLRK